MQSDRVVFFLKLLHTQLGRWEGAQLRQDKTRGKPPTGTGRDSDSGSGSGSGFQETKDSAGLGSPKATGEMQNAECRECSTLQR
jgi:hypothetical protein